MYSLTNFNTDITMTSCELAELTGKKHFHVARDVRVMFEALGEDASKFERTYLDAYGREKPCFRLPYREVRILLAGYSITLRAKVIDRLHELEAQVARTSVHPRSFAEALRLAADLEEQKELLRLQSEAKTPAT